MAAPVPVVPLVEAPVVELGFGNMATDGLVGGVVANAPDAGLGFIQLNQPGPAPMPELRQPEAEATERHMIPMLIQNRGESRIRMASLPFLQQQAVNDESPEVAPTPWQRRQPLLTSNDLNGCMFCT